MPVTVELQNTGDSGAQAELVAVIEHVLSDRPGAWQVSIIGSRAPDNWEMRIDWPNGFQRSYTLVGAAGKHRPELIRNLLGKSCRRSNPSQQHQGRRNVASFVFHTDKIVSRTGKYGTAIVLAHLAVNIIHGAAHHELHVELGSAATIFVIGVIVLCPLIAMVLLWASQERLGLVLLTLSMAASLIFGLYNHFVAISPDHVGKQVPSSWGTAFVLIAYLLVLGGGYWDFHRPLFPVPEYGV